MARRAFVPPPNLAPELTPPPGGSAYPLRSQPPVGGSRKTVPPPSATPLPRSPSAAPPASGMIPDSRRSSPPPSLPSSDVVSIAACAQLLDRLAATDQAQFIVSWIESVLSARTRSDPSLAVRLLRAYRE